MSVEVSDQHLMKCTPVCPENVGITAIELYIPRYFVDQTDLEEYDGVSKGKYTIGLGQKEMGFVSDCEDINSICLTVTKRLLMRNNIDPRKIGRLEVGTETIVDKSKSVKTVLMTLFEEFGNTSIEGIDTSNACYGGTSALFNAVQWMESRQWDGRLAIVVAGDIAVYSEGNARCTGGVGAVAMLVSPNATITIDSGLRGTHMSHRWDFYKPDFMSEYPVVDGQESVRCYLNALDHCYAEYRKKFFAFAQKEGCSRKQLNLSAFDGILFHAPYSKIVQKSLGRLLLNEYRFTLAEEYSELQSYNSKSLDSLYEDKDLERLLIKLSRDLFEKKTLPSLNISKRVGNMYTPSLYSCLVSYIMSKPDNDLANQRIALFSYGSGLTATMFSCKFTSDQSALRELKNSVSHIEEYLNSGRIYTSPQKYIETLNLRSSHHLAKDFSPSGSIEDLGENVFYLSYVDDKFRRFYKFKGV